MADQYGRYRTPFEEMNYNYTNKLGAFKPGPSKDLLPGAVRRATGDIWSKIRQDIVALKQPPRTPPSSMLAQRAGAGTALPESLPGNQPPAGGQSLWGDTIEGAKTLGRGFADVFNKINRGPQGDKPWLTFNNPGAPAEAAASRAPALKPAHSPGHTPTAPTVEPGAPRSTYNRPEGAESGMTRTGQAPSQAGSSMAATGTARPNTSTGNRYLDMYYAGAGRQKKFLNSLPEGQAPVEAIRGTKRTYWSPTTGQEYNTPLEAAFGVNHAEEAKRLADSEKMSGEIKKTTITANAKGSGSGKYDGPKVKQVVEQQVEGPNGMPTTQNVILFEDGRQAIIDPTNEIAMTASVQNLMDGGQPDLAASVALNYPQETRKAMFRNLPPDQAKQLLTVMRAIASTMNNGR